jgi:hypothetical protein
MLWILKGVKMKIFDRRIVIGYNKEKTLRYGIHREYWFTAIGFWPLLIGIGKKEK